MENRETSAQPDEPKIQPQEKVASTTHNEPKNTLIAEITCMLQNLSLTRLEHMRKFVEKIVAFSEQEVFVTIGKGAPDFLQRFPP